MKKAFIVMFTLMISSNSFAWIIFPDQHSGGWLKTCRTCLGWSWNKNAPGGATNPLDPAKLTKEQAISYQQKHQAHTGILVPIYKTEQEGLKVYQQQKLIKR